MNDSKSRGFASDSAPNGTGAEVGSDAIGGVTGSREAAGTRCWGKPDACMEPGCGCCDPEAADKRPPPEAPAADRFDCVACGIGIAADEDGCCAHCGRAAIFVRNHLPTYPPEDTQDEERIDAIEAMLDGRPVEALYSEWGTSGRVHRLLAALRALTAKWSTMADARRCHRSELTYLTKMLEEHAADLRALLPSQTASETTTAPVPQAAESSEANPAANPAGNEGEG